MGNEETTLSGHWGKMSMESSSHRGKLGSAMALARLPVLDVHPVECSEETRHLACYPEAALPPEPCPCRRALISEPVKSRRCSGWPQQLPSPTAGRKPPLCLPVC